MPRWTNPDGADATLARDWDDMIAALRVHENGHRDIAHRAAREVQRTLRRMTDGSCAFISSRADTAARDVLERHRALNRRYDEETRSGAEQGVTLRPTSRVGGRERPS
jgi:predicted secreted Zn-dependent protease